MFMVSSNYVNNYSEVTVGPETVIQPSGLVTLTKMHYSQSELTVNFRITPRKGSSTLG